VNAAKPQDTDSFVDIVTNTAGILVVLVVLSIMQAQKAGTTFNPKLMQLKTMGDSNAARRQALTTITGDREQARVEATSAEEEFKGALSTLSESGGAVARLGDPAERGRALAAAEEEHSTKAARLSTLGEEYTGLVEAKSEAMAAAAQSLADLPEADRTLVTTGAVDAMRGELETVRAESAGLKAAIAELEKQNESLARTAAILDKTLTCEEAQGVQVRGLMAGREMRQKHFIECYRPARSLDIDGVVRPCIRVLDPKNFVREGGTLKATEDGESVFRIIEDDSAYRSFLKAHDDAHKKTHRLHFVVRPDAYQAFRLARKYARDEGWNVEWSPIEGFEEEASSAAP
jgi:hypothetical protein